MHKFMRKKIIFYDSKETLKKKTTIFNYCISCYCITTDVIVFRLKTANTTNCTANTTNCTANSRNLHQIQKLYYISWKKEENTINILRRWPKNRVSLLYNY